MNENWDGVVCSFPLILLETSLHLDRIILFMGLYLDAVRRCPSARRPPFYYRGIKRQVSVSLSLSLSLLPFPLSSPSPSLLSLPLPLSLFLSFCMHQTNDVGTFLFLPLKWLAIESLVSNIICFIDMYIYISYYVTLIIVCKIINKTVDLIF